MIGKWGARILTHISRIDARGGRSLIMRGFKPKDAAEITVREIIFENRDDPDIARRVQIEAKDFLQRVKEGLI